MNKYVFFFIIDFSFLPIFSAYSIFYNRNPVAPASFWTASLNRNSIFEGLMKRLHWCRRVQSNRQIPHHCFNVDISGRLPAAAAIFAAAARLQFTAANFLICGHKFEMQTPSNSHCKLINIHEMAIQARDERKDE